jgi:hypothetical protein
LPSHQYFTSRPALKGYVRASSSFFASARQLQAFTGGAPGDGLSPSNPLYALERALATAQHHDAVSGTERQHVAFDYAKLLARGRADGELLVSAALSLLTGFFPAAGGFAFCELANATICPALESGRPTLVLVYNPQARAAELPVRLSVGFPSGVASWAVLGPDGRSAVTAQLVPASRRDEYLHDAYYGYPSAVSTQWLYFQAAVPAFGFSAFFLVPSATAAGAPATHASLVSSRPAGGADQVLTNGVVNLTLSGATGAVSGYANSRTGFAVPLAQSFFYYRASVGGPNDGTGGSSIGQPATTYIMRPNSSEAFDVGGGSPVQVEMVSGPVVNEARQYVGPGDWMCASLRLWAGSSVVEVESTVGAVDVDDKWGKEVGMRWAAGAGFGGPGPATLFTDSNGLEMQRRVLNLRSWNSTAYTYEPVASNYYPVVARAHIDDDASGRRMTLATDRAVGCASLAPGQLECVLHRRLLVDNFLGNGEALNEPGLGSVPGLVVRGTQWLSFDEPADKAAAGHALAAAALLSPLIAFADLGGAAPPAWAAANTAVFSGLAAGALASAAVTVPTVHSLGGGELLVRLQHLFEAGEDPVLSQNVTVSLAALFSAASGVVVSGAVETSVGGVLPLAQVPQWTLRAQGEADAVTLPIVPPPPAGAGLDVTLAAGEVRTFVLSVSGEEA